VESGVLASSAGSKHTSGCESDGPKSITDALVSIQCPRRTRSELDVVQKTLLEDFQNKGIRYGDVAWRNVGVHHDNNGQLQAVAFDMQQVCHAANKEEDWVQTAIRSLSRKLMH